MLLPSALGFSPHPPVSVYGTGTVYYLAAFLGSWNLALHYSLFAPHQRLCFMRRICLPHSSYACTGLSIPGSPYPSASPHFKILQYRNLHLLSIDYALRPRLRSRLTQGRSALPWKPWIFGRKDSHLPLATHSGILSSRPSTAPYRYSFNETAMLLYQCITTFLSFGVVFQPRTFSAQDLSTSELLRTL